MSTKRKSSRNRRSLKIIELEISELQGSYFIGKQSPKTRRTSRFANRRSWETLNSTLKIDMGSSKKTKKIKKISSVTIPKCSNLVSLTKKLCDSCHKIYASFDQNGQSKNGIHENGKVICEMCVLKRIMSALST